MTYFESEFWQQLVLQLGHAESMVLHAAIALGTLHENEESLGMGISKDRMHDARHRFGVAQYNAAISLLTNGDLGDSTARAATLATCLIFAHIELLRGHYNTAISHVRSGLKILQYRCTYEPQRSAAEAALFAAFATLDLQCAHFGDHGIVIEYTSDNLIDSELSHASSALGRLADVKLQCDKLLGTTEKFMRMCHDLRDNHLAMDDPALYEKQSLLRNFLIAYRHEIGIVICKPDITYKERQWRSAVLLKIMLTAAVIQLSVCLTEDKENAYDAYVSDFAEITALADQFILRSSWSYRRKGPSLTTDSGITPPLFLTAIKCRDTFLRRKAIALMEAWPHREGFWDSSLGVRLAKEVVEVEEAVAMPGVNQGRHNGVRTTNVNADIAADQNGGILTFIRTKNAVRGPEEARTFVFDEDLPSERS